MTLVVTALNDDIETPVMMADCLISVPHNTANIDLPTKLPSHKKHIADIYKCYSNELCRKIAVIHPHLCIGWAGTKILATTILRSIAEQLVADQDLPENIGEIIRGIVLSEAISNETLELTAIIWHNQSKSIEIYSTSEKETLPIIGSTYTMGSGANHFICDRKSQKNTEPPLNHTKPNIRAAQRCISHIHRFFHTDSRTQECYDYGYGGAYEFVYFNKISKRFEYIDNTLLFSYEVETPTPMRLLKNYNAYLDHYCFRSFHTNDEFKIEKFTFRKKTHNGYKLERQLYGATSIATPDYGIISDELSGTFTCCTFYCKEILKDIVSFYYYVDCILKNRNHPIKLIRRKNNWHMSVCRRPEYFDSCITTFMTNRYKNMVEKGLL